MCDVKRVLFVHNRYQRPGGEDTVVENELALLDRHHVITHKLEFSNEHLANSMSLVKQFSAAADAVWSKRAYRLVSEEVASFRPDIVHVHNTFPTASPAVLVAAAEQNAGVVQSLHNYRLLCSNAQFFRNGHICKDCLSHRHLPWPSVQHSCYRGSRTQSSITAFMLAYHRNRGTYLDCVDRYIALTEFCRNQFSEGELPSELISVKPNFLANVPTLGRGGSQFIFIGRLDESKGIRTLLGAALLHPDFRLKIVGSGPLQEEVNGAIEQSNQISYLGQLDRSTILREMQSSLALVLPSLWYEAFPMVIVEAFSCGLPVIASNLGSMAEIVEDQRTGLLFDPGNSADLAAKVRWANDNPEKMRAYGMNARQEFEQKYTAERNYEMLMDIYHQAIEHRKGRPSAQWQK